MASVRGSISEVQREERRKKWIFFAGLLIVLVAIAVLFSASFPTLNPGQNQNTQSTQNPPRTEQISYGNPDSLSYGMPVYSAPDVTFSQQRAMGAMCTSRGTLQCIEPVADSVFVENSRTGISRYEMNVHFLFKSSMTAADVSPSVELDGNPCFFVGSNLTLPAGRTSERIDFLCPTLNSTSNFSGIWKATYIEDGVEKLASGVLRRA